jgi:hypothetical protein
VKRAVKVATVAAVTLVTVCVVSSTAHALGGYWCSKAAEFRGYCSGCNALCIAQFLFDALGGW